MNDANDQSATQNTLRQLKQAQITLQEVENKMRNYKKTRKVVEYKTLKAPYPDLSKYISYLIEPSHSGGSVLSSHGKKSSLNHPATKYNEIVTKSLENNDSIEHLLEKQNKAQESNRRHNPQVTMTIDKIEQYFSQRSQQLDKRIEQLLAIRAKIKRDQTLLIHNNKQLQDEIEVLKRSMISEREIITLRSQVDNLKNNIQKIEQQKNKIQNRKKELQLAINDCARNQKDQVMADMPRSKSTVSRCPYH